MQLTNSSQLALATQSLVPWEMRPALSAGTDAAMFWHVSADDSIDEDALARLVDFHVEGGTDALVAVGTTGESATVDFQEHCR